MTRLSVSGLYIYNDLVAYDVDLEGTKKYKKIGITEYHISIWQ